MVSIFFAIIKEENVLAADALCLGTLACSTRIQMTPDVSVKVILSKRWRIFLGIALGGAAGADLIENARPHVGAISNRF